MIKKIQNRTSSNSLRFRGQTHNITNRTRALLKWHAGHRLFDRAVAPPVDYLHNPVFVVRRSKINYVFRPDFSDPLTRSLSTGCNAAFELASKKTAHSEGKSSSNIVHTMTRKLKTKRLAHLVGRVDENANTSANQNPSLGRPKPTHPGRPRPNYPTSVLRQYHDANRRFDRIIDRKLRFHSLHRLIDNRSPRLEKLCTLRDLQPRGTPKDFAVGEVRAVFRHAIDVERWISRLIGSASPTSIPDEILAYAVSEADSSSDQLKTVCDWWRRRRTGDL
jgi:hypothetical protein